MERNFFRRIELAFPVLDRKLKRRVIAEGLQIYLTDNTLAWELGPDGTTTSGAAHAPARIRRKPS
jgi:polyphosphate kinase